MKGSNHITTPPPHPPAAADAGAGDRLSGAYIRSLAKHLTPSTPPKTQPQARAAAGAGAGPHKKQVRRRLHTTRPYQERLLNMAEARKEIVTALKLHRAAMRQPPPPAPPEPAPALSDGFAALPSQALGLNLSLDPAGFAAAAFPAPAVEDGGAAAERAPAEEAGGEVGWRDSEMLEEIKWIGEMHEMEWNDSVNLAWWFNFQEEDDCYYRQAVEFPLVGSDPYKYRMSSNEEIEGLDEGWLS